KANPVISPNRDTTSRATFRRFCSDNGEVVPTFIAPSESKVVPSRHARLEKCEIIGSPVETSNLYDGRNCKSLEGLLRLHGATKWLQAKCLVSIVTTPSHRNDFQHTSLRAQRHINWLNACAEGQPGCVWTNLLPCDPI